VPLARHCHDANICARKLGGAQQSRHQQLRQERVAEVVDAKCDLVTFGCRPRPHAHDAGIQNGNVQSGFNLAEPCHSCLDRLERRKVDGQVADGRRVLVGHGVADVADDGGAIVGAWQIGDVDACRVVPRKFDC
jgi:hypothetical protein